MDIGSLTAIFKSRYARAARDLFNMENPFLEQLRMKNDYPSFCQGFIRVFYFRCFKPKLLDLKDRESITKILGQNSRWRKRHKFANKQWVLKKLEPYKEGANGLYRTKEGRH